MAAIPIPVTTPLDRIELIEHDAKQRSHLEVLSNINGILVEVDCREIKYHREAIISAELTYLDGTKMRIHYPRSFYTKHNKSPLWQAAPHMKAIEKVLVDYIRKNLKE